MTTHPIFSELNPEQMKAATQMKNCVVAAGAGSGKTRVLSYRYAHLVIEHNFPVDSILTLTFTKKATSEMFERIYKTLKDIVIDAQSTSIQKERAEKAIENFHTARIQTIDSFCSSILRLASRQYGIRPDFVINNEEVKDYITKKARDFMLEYRNEDCILAISGDSKFETIQETLLINPFLAHSNIAHQIDFNATLDTQITKAIEIWTTEFDFIYNSKHDIGEKINDFSEVFDELENCSLDKIALKSYFNDTTSNYNYVKSNIVKLMKALYVLNKAPLKGPDNIKDVFKAYRISYKNLSAISQFILNYPQTLKLIPLLEDYQSNIIEWKRSTGNLTYSDVSHLALKTLLENPEIRRSEKNKINAIMIDEFQDNNSMQKDMLYLLAEQLDRNDTTIPQVNELCPEKLFFVGDEKQSIYKFRGADVSVFRKLKNEMEPNNLYLSKNYRSAPQLISGFNAFFGGYEYNNALTAEIPTKRIENSYSIFLQNHQILPEESYPIFEAEYEQAFSNELKEGVEIDLDKKLIHISLLDKTKTDDSDTDTTNDSNTTEETEKEEDLVEAENIAVFTAEKIKILCETSYKPENIAILFRSYSNQSLYEKHLRRLGIPYVAENITNFFGDAPINDITSYIRLLVYPKDTMAYGTLLRSPFVGLSQQEALSCIIESENNNEEEFIFNTKNASKLSETNKETYYKGRNKYLRMKEILQNTSCTNIVSTLWYEEGYRFETMWNADVRLFAEFYDFLFEIARKLDSEGKNITYFADYLLELQKNDEKLEDMNIPLERDGAVQLMSIHKSKGLEFPVVFVSGISSIGRKNRNENKIYFDEEFGPSFNFPTTPDIPESKNNYFFELAKKNETLRSEAELRRVLYVAMTRAEKELFITGSFKLNKDTQKAVQKEISDEMIESTDPVIIESKLNLYLSKRWEIIQKKEKQKENTIVCNEYCREGDNFFAFLMPLLYYYRDKKAPFTLEEIKSRTQQELIQLSNEKKETKFYAFNRVKDGYENAKIIQTPIIPNRYKSPSHLAHEKDIDYQKNDNYDNGEHSIPELDAIIKKEGFDYSDFGTIAHAFAETIFTKTEPNVPSQIMQKLSSSPTSLKTVYALAQTMADNFASSELGKEALSSTWQKTEHSFKYLLKNTENKTIINGSIDLLFEKQDGTLVIVDYKTDSVQDCSIHLAQLAAYQQAVSKIFSKSIENVQCYIFYLRTATAVDITKECLKIDLIDFIE